MNIFGRFRTKRQQFKRTGNNKLMHNEGEVIHMTDNSRYVVLADGSWRKWR